jgi:DNA-binding response OmpR family regulator
MKRILIIEDDKHAAAALRARFESGGYETTVANDAPQGRALAQLLKPDLISLDIALPGGDGLELAREFSRLPETRGTPVILVTGNKDERLRRKAMELNAAGLCEKPYDPDELLALAQFALSETSSFSRRQPLPAAGTSARNASPAPAAHELAGRLASRSKVLIIEDDREIAFALELRLKQAGCRITTAYDALSGLNAAVRLQPDLVLLDISMPAGNGFAVAEKLRTQVSPPPVIIFLTASKRADFRARAEALGAAAFLEKPYDPKELVAKVVSALRTGSQGQRTPANSQGVAASG